MPVRKSSRPLLEVSIWPLNIRFFPELEPDQRATTLARPSSISCQVTFRPSCCRAARIYCAICSSSPVGLGMLMTSQAMETSSSSRTQERIFSANFASSADFDSDFFAVVVIIRSFLYSCSRAGQAKIVRVRAELFVAVAGNPEIVFQAQPAPAGPVNARLDGQNHALADGAAARLMRIGILVSAGAHSVANGMRWLAGIAAFGDPRTDQAIELRQAGPIDREAHGFFENLEQKIEQALVLGRELAWANVLRKIGPIAVDANPNFEKSRLVLLHRAVARCRKGGNSLPGPHQSEGAGHFDLAFVTHADPVNKTFVDCADFALFHPWTQAISCVLHGERGEFVRELHTLDLLRRLDGASLVEQRRAIDNFARDLAEGVKEILRWSGGFADHAVGGLRSHVELDADFARKTRLFEHIKGGVQRTVLRRTRIALVIALEEANLGRPGIPLRVGELRLKSDQCRFSLAREDERVITFHAPIVREIKNVVGRAHDQGLEVLVFHQGADAF